MPDSAARPAVFLDRDGAICEEMGYLNHLSRFHIFPFTAVAVARLNQAGFPVVVVTNQSGIAHGIFPEQLVHQIHERMTQDLAAAGARLDAIYFCPHRTDESCECRKPHPGMLNRAAREHQLDLRRSWVVGDRYLDIEMAHRVGGRGILVLTGYGRGEYELHHADWPRQPESVAEDLSAAVDFILKETR